MCDLNEAIRHLAAHAPGLIGPLKDLHFDTRQYNHIQRSLVHE